MYPEGEGVESGLTGSDTLRRRPVTPVQDRGVDEKGKSPASQRPGKPGLEGDYVNIALLLLLYTLQGIPLGLSATLDLILQEKKLTYEQQGVFNSVSWPYSLKVLWAPIVDSIFIKQFGRRKSWLVPTQFLIGVLLVLSPDWIDELMGNNVSNGEQPQEVRVAELTALFFTFYLLAATQDVALDGWAVEILYHKSYASTCNAIGQSIGFFTAFGGYMGLEVYGYTNLNSFMKIWGVIFLVVTTAVAVFKHEKTEKELEEEKQLLPEEERQFVEAPPESVGDAYRQMGMVLRLPGVQALLFILFTRGIAFASADSLAQRKLMERGMKKEQVASLTVILTPLNILLPGIVSKQTTDRPLGLFKQSYLPRVGVGLLSLLLVLFAPDFEHHKEIPWFFFVCLAGTMIIHSILQSAMFVSIMAFFAQVSDPSIGGSYMTLLNTMANLGSKLPNFLSVFMLHYLTFKTCDDEGENCEVYLDGFIVISVFCVLFGLYWYRVYGPQLDRLQDLDLTAWRVSAVVK